MSQVVVIILLLLVLLVFGTLAYASLSAAPWVPLFRRDVKRMVKLAGLKSGEVVYDLGAGDGRILLECVKQQQVTAVGWEIALLPFLIAKLRIWLNKTGKKASLRYQNFYQADLRSADVIFCFLTPQAMRKLETKISLELKPGARFLSYAFSFPTWQPSLVDKPQKNSTAIFLYQRE